MDFEKIVIVTQKTWLDGLIERYGSKQQAKFYIEHMGGTFEEYETTHTLYYETLRKLKMIASKYKIQIIEKAFLPNFLFGPKDLVIVLGRDGLVVNTAKYLASQPILAINPDPDRNPGILLPFQIKDVAFQLERISSNEEKVVQITLALANLSSQQHQYAFNDLFIGHRSHQSARYIIRFQGEEEKQISSGIIVSTGAGSTGWYKSIITGAIRINQGLHDASNTTIPEINYKFPWDSNFLRFCVREPWESQVSESNIVYGEIFPEEQLEIESLMPEGGVIFSDGIENDYLSFSSGIIARIGIAAKTAKLIVKS